MHASLRIIPKKLAIELNIPSNRYIDRSTRAVYKKLGITRKQNQILFVNDGIPLSHIILALNKLGINL